MKHVCATPLRQRAQGADFGRSARRGLGLTRTPFLGGSSSRRSTSHLNSHKALPHRPAEQRHAAPELCQGTGPRWRVHSDTGTRRCEGAPGCAASSRQPETTVRRRETIQNQGTASTSSLDEGRRHLTDKDRQMSSRGPSFQRAVGSAVKCAGLAAGVQIWIHQIYKKTNQRSSLFLCLLSPWQNVDKNGVLPHQQDQMS